MNTITIELCAEDRARLDGILEALKGYALPADTIDTIKAMEAPTPVEAPKPAEPVQLKLVTEEKPVEEKPVEDAAPWEGPEEPAPKYTADDVRAKVQKLASPTMGKRDAVKKIVEEYAPSVRLIPEDKYPEVMAKLTALEEV